MNAIMHTQYEFGRNRLIKKEARKKNLLLKPQKSTSQRSDTFLKTETSEQLTMRQQSSRTLTKSKFSTFYNKLGWSLTKKPEERETVVYDQVHFDILTSESIQLNFSTNIFSKRSVYQTEIK